MGVKFIQNQINNIINSGRIFVDSIYHKSERSFKILFLIPELTQYDSKGMVGFVPQLRASTKPFVRSVTGPA